MLRILLIMLMPAVLFAQGWKWENPKPFGDPIQQVFFRGSVNGWMVPKNPTLLRTTDGKNWDIIYTNIYFTNIYFFDKNEGWGIGRKHFIPETSNNIYHSTNGGITWEVQLADTNVSYTNNIYFLDKLNGWVTTDDPYSNPVLHTTNGGKNWIVEASELFRLSDGQRLYVLFANNSRGWIVGGSFYSLRTENSGKIWQKDSTILGRKIINLDSLHLWVLSGSAVSRSIDGGNTWVKHTFAESSLQLSPLDLFALDTNNVYLSAREGFYSSTDGGVTWGKKSNEFMNSFWFPNKNEVWGGGGNIVASMVHSTNAGETWAELVENNFPAANDDYIKVDFVNKSTGWICTRNYSSDPEFTSSVIKTMDEGKTWNIQNIKPTNWIRDILMLDENTGFIVGDSGMIYKTTDGGKNWLLKSSGTIYRLQNLNFINNNFGWIVGQSEEDTTSIILKTTDGGDTWKGEKINITNLESICFVDSLNGWIVSNSKSNFIFGGIYHTTNGGNNWNLQFGGLYYNFSNVLFLDSTRGFVIGSDFNNNGPVYETINGGKSWTIKNLSQHTLIDISFANKNDGWIVGAYGKIFKTTDSGNNWNEQESYTSKWLFSLTFTDTNNGWAVGEFGTVLHTTNGGITFINIKDKEENSLLRKFILYQNYPNPFNPSTTIKYELPQNSSVSILIFDILGRKVTIVANENQPSGEHKLIIDLSSYNLSSGIYFYQLNATPLEKKYSTFSITNKMVYLK